MCTPSKDTRRRRVYSQIKEEKEEKEKEGEKEEIVNGIYLLIEWSFSTCYSIINLFTSSIFKFWLKISETQQKCQSSLKIVKIQNRIQKMRFKLNNFNPIVISYNFYFSLFYLLFPIVISYNLYYTMKKLWYDTPTYTYTYMQTKSWIVL